MKNILTIVIPTYNRGDILLKKLDVILSNATGAKILILDNCSTTKINEYLRIDEIAKNLPELTYIRNIKNINMEGSLFKALEIVDTDYVLFLSDEDIVMPNVANMFMEFLKKHGDFFAIRPSIMSAKDEVFSNQYGDVVFKKIEGIPIFGLTGNYISGQIYNARFMRRENIIQTAREALFMLPDYPHLLLNILCAAAGRTAFVSMPYVQMKDVAYIGAIGAPDSWASFYVGATSYGVRFNQFLGLRDILKLVYGGIIDAKNAELFWNSYVALFEKYAYILLAVQSQAFLEKNMHPRFVGTSFFHFALAATCNLPFVEEVLPKIAPRFKLIINKFLKNIGAEEI